MWQAPIICPDQSVEPEWIDYNGHLNMAYYNVLFDRSVDHFYDLLGVGIDYTRAAIGSCFSLEVHVSYLSEITADESVRITLQLLDHDEKRLHFIQQMSKAKSGELAATSEQLALHIDMQARRAAPFPDAVRERIQALSAAHAGLAAPDQVGRVIGIRRKNSVRGRQDP